MRTLLLFTTLAMMTTACTDDETCLDGVCADHGETRTLPGPCAIATDSFLKRCDLTYDTANRPATSLCTVYGGLEDETYRTEAFWTYEATTGELASYEHKSTRRDGFTRWSWEPTRVRVDRLDPNTPPALVQLYDRALFQFSPEPGIVGQLFPDAMLGLLVDVQGGTTKTYAWTREGHRLTQTSATGSTAFDLDDQERLISIADGYSTYTYDGDRLASTNIDGQIITYTYDAGGNIAEAADSYGQKQVFSYECW